MADTCEAVRPAAAKRHSRRPSEVLIPSAPRVEAPPSNPPAVERHRVALFPAALGLALVVLLSVAFVSDPKPVSTKPAPPAATTPSPSSADLVREIERVRGSLETLSTRIDRLQTRIDGLPRTLTSGDLEPMQSKLGEVGQAIAALLKQVAAHEPSLAGVRAEVGVIRAEVRKLSESATSTVAAIERPTAEPPHPLPPDSSTSTEPGLASDNDFRKGLDLYKTNRFREANEIFRKLTSAFPDDARVWYSAALTSGMTTSQWHDGETLRLVTQGVERERAGKPSTPQVDTFFADLESSSRAWLEFYRRVITRR